ncbi:MAG: CRISPR-associated endonuclease Cas2 [Oscillospiraceae bacterium]|nr:CRISPR-associated endonuclease Cas2 [Oscillospiraceae bacterium]
MLVLITYDVSTQTAAGKGRLRKVAKACVDHGQRVQNSVFECVLDAAQYAKFKQQLIELIDPETDSLRFYNLGNHYAGKVEHVGAKETFEQERDVLIV